MEQQTPNTPRQGWDFPPEKPAGPKAAFFPTGIRELVFGLLILLSGMLLCNSVLFGGFNLGFAIFAGACILCTTGYLLASGCRFTVYSGALLGLSLVLCAAFARSDDGFVKFVMVCFLLVSVNLGLCLLAGQNRRTPGGVASLLDASRALFMLGVGKQPEAWRGLGHAFRRSGSVGKKGGAVLLGLLIAVPILAIMIPLLTSADAAFDALLQMLPEWDFSELTSTVFFGTFLVCLLYVRGVALRHSPKAVPAERAARKGMSALTVNTVLGAVVLVYAVYLISQLAYFSGGFSGILPQGYTLAQYARRGFFEMAWLCAINLGIIALAVGLVAKKQTAPLATRLLCLFIGIVTLFLVVTASAKMFLYIGSYGLTRLRGLTEIIMIWLGITTLLVTVWLFAPRLPYMKAVLLTALVIGAAVFWADVDTVVARYNVSAYQSGRLESVDVWYLNELGDGAVPYLQLLAKDADHATAFQAQRALNQRYASASDDFRDWNYVNHLAERLLNQPAADSIVDMP